MQHRRARGPLPDRRAPVICSTEPLNLVGTATWMLFFRGSWCKPQQCEARASGLIRQKPERKEGPCVVSGLHHLVD
jgi:hypothetical protein